MPSRLQYAACHLATFPSPRPVPVNSIVTKARETNITENVLLSAACMSLCPTRVEKVTFGADQTDSNREPVSVYYAVDTEKGTDFYCADTSGHHSRLWSLESSSPLLGLFWYSSKRQLVSVAQTGEMYIHGKEEGQDSWQQIVTMKVGGGAAPNGPALMVAWVGGHTLASANGRDATVRMYDLDSEDNYILHIGRTPP